MTVSTKAMKYYSEIDDHSVLNLKPLIKETEMISSSI